MCGLAGYLAFDGRPAAIAVLQSMSEAIRHRGPDGEGIFIDGPMGIAHRRLAVIDLSAAADQPMASVDGRYVIAYNGEVYNFLDLRRELEGKGHTFRSRSDTEVVLAAFAQWGGRAVERFNGMFALAIWDKRDQRLFLARDRYGIKPLYIHHTGGLFAFGSEIKALIAHPAIKAALDAPALLEYFTFQNMFSDRTLFAGIHLLPAGHRGWLSRDGNWRAERYWDFDFREPSEVRSAEEYEEELHRLFVQAVRRQMVSDVPLGAYLSGGMDSGGVTAVATQESPHVVSITAGFDMTGVAGNDSGTDERARAETLSTRFRTEHYQVVIKSGDMERSFPSVVRHIEDLRVGQSYPNWYVSRLASRFVKVILAGTGGDELFAGYPWRYYRAVNSTGFDDFVEKYYSFWNRLVPNTTISELFQPQIWDQVRDIRTVDIFRGVLNGHAPSRPEEYINTSLYFESKTFLHGLLLVEDRLSMAHGLETRLPFLDNDLVDFAQRLPVRSKLRDLDLAVRIDENQPGYKSEAFFAKTNDGKLILRSMLDRLLPPDYVSAVKQGFSGPDASWFRGDSAGYVRATIMMPEARLYEVLRPETVMPLIEEHLDGRVNRRLLIWSLLCFEWWLRTFLP
jgi:asparagine synthase (glutamine-hydrolysing)